MIQQMDVYEALQKIVDNRRERALDYAVNYAKYALSIPRSRDDELRTQVLYVVSNITHWRGEVATEVRASLKAFIGR